MGSSGDHRAGTFSWQVIRVYTDGKSGSQNGNSGLFSRKYLGAENEAPNAFAQTQTVHLGKDHAMVLLALQALLGRDFDKVMVVSEERSPKCARLGQLRLICRSKLPFLIC